MTRSLCSRRAAHAAKGRAFFARFAGLSPAERRCCVAVLERVPPCCGGGGAHSPHLGNDKTVE
jgi:hypothetical protein